MIKVGNKVLRNEQEQVDKNMQDIETLMKNKGYYGPYTSLESIPEIDLTPNWIYLVGDDAPYQAYLYQGLDSDSDPVFIYLGYFPLSGPQGPQGPAGADGSSISENSAGKSLLQEMGSFVYASPFLCGDDSVQQHISWV